MYTAFIKITHTLIKILKPFAGSLCIDIHFILCTGSLMLPFVSKAGSIQIQKITPRVSVTQINCSGFFHFDLLSSNPRFIAVCCEIYHNTSQ